MIFDFEILRDEVLKTINEFKYEFNSKNSKVGYLLGMINNIRDTNSKVVKSDGTEVTEKFINSLRELMEDELGREYLYRFKELKRDDIYKSDGKFQRIPTFIGVNSETFSIIYLPDDVEIARSVITKSGDFEYTVDFLELRTEYNKTSFYKILKDCIQEKYGNVDFRFDSKSLFGMDKTGLRDVIPKVEEKKELKERNTIELIPEIKLQISDVKIRERKEQTTLDLFGGF